VGRLRAPPSPDSYCFYLDGALYSYSHCPIFMPTSKRYHFAVKIDSPKRCYPTTNLQGITTPKNMTSLSKFSSLITCRPYIECPPSSHTVVTVMVILLLLRGSTFLEEPWPPHISSSFLYVRFRNKKLFRGWIWYNHGQSLTWRTSGLHIV